MKSIPEGTVVQCPHCGEEPYKFVKDIPEQKIVTSVGNFIGINGYTSPKKGERMRCPNCEGWLVRTLKTMGGRKNRTYVSDIHVRGGWATELMK